MTLRKLYRQVAAQLRQAGVEEANHDAASLVCFCFQITREALLAHGDAEADAARIEQVWAYARRRAGGEPLQYILGQWEFMGMPFSIGEGVLIPRDDTEVLVRRCESFFRSNGLEQVKIADLCAGSGTVSIGIQSLLPKAQITAVELSDTAYRYLQKNVRRNGMQGIQTVQGDIFDCWHSFPAACLDAVVSNPPYIATKELDGLQREISWEPTMALDGGADGLRFYRAIAQHWANRVKPGGLIAVEIGEEQAAQVAELFSHVGVQNIGVDRDIQGLDRVVWGTAGK